MTGPAAIAYLIADSAMGRLLVAATPRGLCAVSLGDDDATLLAWLRADYPRASLRPDDQTPAAAAAALAEYLRGERRDLGLALDLPASAFQTSVWAALRAIPYGATRTYAQIAAGLGGPGLARAVGRACATNPVSLAIPCHRAVGSDGKLHGFRWGLQRKQALLELEARALAGPPPALTQQAPSAAEAAAAGPARNGPDLA